MKKQAKKFAKKPPLQKKAFTKKIAVKNRNIVVASKKAATNNKHSSVKTKKQVTKKRIKIIKPLGTFVVFMGVLAMILLISFAVAGFFSSSETTDTPVLGASTGLVVPTGFKATVVNYSVMLSWDNMTDGQYQYVVWVYDSSIKKYNPEAIIDGNGSIGDVITKIYDQKPGTTLLYKVSMCEGCQFSEYHKIIGDIGGLSSGSVVTVPRIPTPSSLRASSDSDGVTLTWSQLPGVDGFNIWRSSSFFGSYRKVGSVGTDGTYSSWHTMTDGVYDVPVDEPSLTTFTDTTAAPGAFYFYRISAKKMITPLTYEKGWVNVGSRWSGFKFVRAAKLSGPKGFSAETAAKDRIIVSADIKDMSLTDGYYLYCDKCDNKKMRLLPAASSDIQFASAKTDDNTMAFSLKNLDSNTRYGLRLTSYKIVYGKVYESDRTSTVYVKTADTDSPATPEDFRFLGDNENGAVSFGWAIPTIAVTEHNMLIECWSDETKLYSSWVGKPEPVQFTKVANSDTADSYGFIIDDFKKDRGVCIASLSVYDSKTKLYSESATVTFKDESNN